MSVRFSPHSVNFLFNHHIRFISKDLEVVPLNIRYLGSIVCSWRMRVNPKCNLIAMSHRIVEIDRHFEDITTDMSDSRRNPIFITIDLILDNSYTSCSCI